MDHVCLAANKSTFKSISKIVETAYKRLHEKGSYSVKDIKEYSDLIEATQSVLKDGLTIGISDIEIPAVMLEALEKDIFIFSGLKTHAQLLEASSKLLENGKIRSFSSFQKEVKKLKANYNENYLEAEYNFAITSSQSAAKWNQFEESGDRYYLQYRTANDDKVRISHQPLHDVTLPPDDPFWAQYTPPNGWRCRCTYQQVLKSRYEVSDSQKATEAGDLATTQINKSGKNSLEIFRFNPGKEKVVFPPNHPYRKLSDSKSVIKQLK